jgi:hypothetical protein
VSAHGVMGRLSWRAHARSATEVGTGMAVAMTQHEATRLVLTLLSETSWMGALRGGGHAARHMCHVANMQAPYVCASGRLSG